MMIKSFVHFKHSKHYIALLFSYGEGKFPKNPIIEISKQKVTQMMEMDNKSKSMHKDLYIQNQLRIKNKISQLKQLPLKDFSVEVQHLVQKTSKKNLTNVEAFNQRSLANQTQIWRAIQAQFLARLKPTTNPQQIRSYAKVLYSLSKSKQASMNYESKFGIMLPFATHQSFAMIVSSISRMGPLSRQFALIVQKVYLKMLNQSVLNIRQRVQLAYTLTKNGYKLHDNLIQHIDSMNLNQILLMLRAYDNSNTLQKQILQKCQKQIISRSRQVNVIDLTDIIYIYFKYTTTRQFNYQPGEQLLKLIGQVYRFMVKNIDEIIFQKIWKYFPEMINTGLLSIKFVNSVIITIKIFKKKELFKQEIWMKMKKDFTNITNLQVRVQLEKIT